jgi:hypothetical protein
MARRPTQSHALAMQAAKAVSDLDDRADETLIIEAPTPITALPKRAPGRPKGRREVEARLTLYLDPRRHEALRRLADDRGRSIHSLVIEGVDGIIGKPAIKAWE